MFRSLTTFAGRLVVVTGFVLACAIAAGFLTDLHPLFDSLSHFRAHLGILALLGGVAALFVGGQRTRIVSLFPLIAGITALASVAPFLIPQTGGPSANTDITLLQMNVLKNRPNALAMDRIRASEADILTLEEVTSSWDGSLRELARDFPYSGSCGGTWLLSRFPFVGDRPDCPASGGFLIRTVDLGEGRTLAVVAVHLNWPWPYAQHRQVGELASVLSERTGPTVVAGDFNAAPWSNALRRTASAAHGSIVQGIGPSWLTNRLPASLKAFVGLPIDNIVISPGIDMASVETLKPTASDHLPVLARLSILPRSDDTATGN